MKQRKSTTGFTLIESVVVISIITILTYLVLNALPLARTNQEMENDLQQLRSFLSRAQQQALNEIREDDCLSFAGSDEDAQRRCSDVGVLVASGSLTMFADIDGNGDYSNGADFIIDESDLAAGVEGNIPVSIVFASTPPTIITLSDVDVLAPNESAVVKLELEDASRELTIGPYGIIEYAQ